MAESLFAADAPAGSFNDATTYELGLGWRASVDGTCTGIRVYGPSTAPSSCVVSLYAIDSSITGTLLATKTAPVSLTPGAWNSVLFDVPVSITAGVHYRAQYRTPNWYTFTASKFTSAATTVGNLTAFQHGVEPGGDPYPNGSLLVGTGYASNSGNGAWYGQDVLFEPAGSISGSLAVALPALSGVLTGTVTASGILAVVLPRVTVSAAGSLAVAGSATTQLPGFTANLTGFVTVAGPLSASLPSLTVRLAESNLIRRPNTGTTGRPSTGTITRPFTGVTTRP